MSSSANVSQEEGDGKTTARSISIADRPLKLIDVAASLAGQSRSAFMVEHSVAAAKVELREHGIDPDSVMQAA